MSVPRTAADVLRQHVTLEVEGIDRMYLNVYQPRLQCEGQVAAFFRHHRGHTFASSALMDPMSKAFIAAVEDFTRQQDIPFFSFTPGQRKEEVALEHRARFRGTEGILFVGKAQEKTPVFRTEKRKNPKTGQTFPWIVRSTAMVNHFYFYGIDEDFVPFFFRVCTDFPYNARLCINGREYVEGQLAKKGIAFGPLDNGVRSCADLNGSSNSATASRPPRSTRCCGSGWGDCSTRSPRRTAPTAIAATCRASRPRSGRGRRATGQRVVVRRRGPSGVAECAAGVPPLFPWFLQA